MTIGINGITAYLAMILNGIVGSNSSTSSSSGGIQTSPPPIIPLPPRFRCFAKNPIYNFRPQDHKSMDYRDYQIKLYDADADADGIIDILAINGKQDGLKWMPQLPGMAMTAPTNLLVPVAKSPDSFDIYDMNQDGVDDIIINSDTDNVIYMYAGKR
jgi:hypothetical protein